MVKKTQKQREAERERQKRYRIQKKAEIVFRLSNGWPECEICGKKLPSNLTLPEEESGVTMHHKIRLASMGVKRPNGNKARVLEWFRNMWNLQCVCPECHEKLHEGEKAEKMINNIANTIVFVEEGIIA